jgi:hypothetical protein
MLPFLIWRLLDEERFLANELPGYTEYQKEVQYRLVPGSGNGPLSYERFIRRYTHLIQ